MHLVLVPRDDPSERRSFERLARRVSELAPDVRACVLLDRPNRRRGLPLLTAPTLVVAMKPLRRFRPWRGTVLQGKRPGKAWELERLGSAGVPTPRGFLLDRESADAPERAAELGPWVVTKPNLGARGRLVRLMAAERVRWRSRYAERGGVLVQEFVYTGPWPSSLRVATLLGEPLYALRADADRSRPPLPGRNAWRKAPGDGFSIVAGHRGCRWSFSEDAAALEVARRAAAALPEIPLLGIDMVRDADTGRWLVLEVNPNGRTWHFASEVGRSLEADAGLDLETQMDGFDRAARRLADEARRLAR